MVRYWLNEGLTGEVSQTPVPRMKHGRSTLKVYGLSLLFQRGNGFDY